MSQEKILVIEDEKDLVKILKYNLEKEGSRVSSALPPMTHQIAVRR